MKAKEQQDAWAKEAEVERAKQVEADKAAAVEEARAEALADHKEALQRIEEVKQSERDDREKREADVTHRATIHDEISAALSAMRGNASPDQIATALMNGDIPHTKVTL